MEFQCIQQVTFKSLRICLGYLYCQEGRRVSMSSIVKNIIILSYTFGIESKLKHYGTIHSKTKSNCNLP